MRHEPTIASGVSTVVSSTSGRLTPSTPSRNRTPSERTQSAVTPSWKPSRPTSNRRASATDSPKAARLNARAVQRTSGCCARGIASSARAPARGTKTVKVSSTGVNSPPSCRGPDDEEGEQQHGAAEHADGIGADKTGLQPASAAGTSRDGAGHAVHRPVDDVLVHRPGQEPHQRAPEPDREQLVQLVDVELGGERPPHTR